MAKRTRSIADDITFQDTNIGEIRADIACDFSMVNISLNIYDNSNIEAKKDSIKSSVDLFIKDLKDEILDSDWNFILKRGE